MKSRLLSRGLTLIELMVAIAIGLFIVLAVVNVMVTQEGIRRSATSGSDSTANAAIGMLLIERSLKNSGYGMSPGVASGLMDTCTPQGVSLTNSARTGATTTTFAAFQFAPAIINPSSIPAGDTNTQIIRVTYSGSQLFGASAINTKSVSPLVRVNNRAGLNAGDLVVLGQAGVGCGIRQITALPNNQRCGTSADLPNSDVVQVATGTLRNDYQSCASQTTTFNGDGSLPFSGFTASTSSAPNLRIFSLGDAARFRSLIFAVRRYQLTMCDFIASPCEDAARTADTTVWQPLVDDVVSLRAQYGVDTDGNGVVDSWTAAAPAAIATINNTIAVRLALVTRAKAYNKDEVVVDLGPGKNSPMWTAGDIDVSHVPDWKHYRYTVNETTVPLKNVIWNN